MIHSEYVSFQIIVNPNFGESKYLLFQIALVYTPLITKERVNWLP